MSQTSVNTMIESSNNKTTPGPVITVPATFVCKARSEVTKYAMSARLNKQRGLVRGGLHSQYRVGDHESAGSLMVGISHDEYRQDGKQSSSHPE